MQYIVPALIDCFKAQINEQMQKQLEKVSDASKYAACLLHFYKVFFFLVMLIIFTMEDVESLHFHFHGAGVGIEGPEKAG